MKFGVKFLAILLVSLICATMLTSCFPGLDSNSDTSSDTSSDNIIVIPPNGDQGGNNGNDGGNNGNTSGSVVIENITAPYIADVHVSTSVEPDEENKVPSGGVNLDSSLASATIPGGVQLEEGAKEVVLTINGIEDSKADVELLESEVSSSFDVHVSGVAENNLVPMEIKLAAAAAKGLNSTSIKLYHVENGETIAMTLIPSSAEFTAHNQFKYNPATGDITLSIASFSEIMVVSDTENAWNGTFDYSWYDANPEADEFIIASAEQLAAFGAIVGGMQKVTGRSDNVYTYDGYAYTGIYDDGTEYHHYSFAGKTVTLIANINLGDKESENNPDIIFYPIGYYNEDGTYEKTNKAITSGLRNFEGTFDGNGHTISNFYQNTWEMKGDHNWYDGALQYYRDGMGLFGRVYGATVKNITVENFSSDGEITTTGVIAAYADGATLQNISIFNCNPRVYNIGNGGIVGCVGWYAKEADLKTTFTNITVDNSNKISALWGSYDVACGGIVGQYYPTSGQSSYEYPVNGGIDFTNCHVSAVMDVYNDVCANYQYYAYRYTGMFIGSVRENVTGEDGRVYPDMTGITAKYCTVYFGDWNDYYYCELVANSLASYTHDHQMSRLTQVASVDAANMTVIDLDGNEADIPTEGRVNYVVVKAKDADDKWIHGDGHDFAECYHFVNGVQHFHDVADTDNPTPTEMVNGVETLKEDKQLIYREFNQLFTGYGWGVTSKGLEDYNGVNNKDIIILEGEVEGSVEKFESTGTVEFGTGSNPTVSQIFQYITDCGVEIKNDQVIVTVSSVTGSTAGATLNPADSWGESTLALEGIGALNVTISDYYYCKSTTVTINVTAANKFEYKYGNEEQDDFKDFILRVGNQNTFTIGLLFDDIAPSNIGIDANSVEIKVLDANNNEIDFTFVSNKSDWKLSTLKFMDEEGNPTYEGVAKIVIKDETSYECSATVEIVNALNATGATDATSNNVVLLKDISGGFNVSNGYAFHGNGFKVTCSGKGYRLNVAGMYGGFIEVENGGVLDNVEVYCDIYPSAFLYASEAKTEDNKNEISTNERFYYNYQLSAVAITGIGSMITNSYIYGARNNVYVGDGNVTIENTTLENGALANVQIKSTNASTVKLNNLTTIQNEVVSTYDSTKTMLGCGILVGDVTSQSNPQLIIQGEWNHYNWVTTSNAVNTSSNYAKEIINKALTVTDYVHTNEDSQDTVNLGVIVLNTLNANIDDQRDVSSKYKLTTITMELTDPETKLSGQVNGQVYSVTAGNGKPNDVIEDYVPTQNRSFKPNANKDITVGGNEDANDGGEDSRYCYWEGDLLKLMYKENETPFTINVQNLFAFYKYNNLLNHTVDVTLNGNSLTLTNGNATFGDAGTYVITYTVTDNYNYDKDGNVITEPVEWTFTYEIEVSLVKQAGKTATIDVTSNSFYGAYGKTGVFEGTDYHYCIPFMRDVTITDYAEDGETALTFDATKNIINIAVEGDKSSGTVTFTYLDGRVLIVKVSGHSVGLGSTGNTISVKSYNNQLWISTDGVSNNATTGTWTVTSYKFTGNNGVPVEYTTARTCNFDSASTTNSPQTSWSSYATPTVDSIKYTVTFDANGGTCSKTFAYATSSSTAVTLPTPTRSGYIFTGWYTAASGGTKVGGAGDSYTPDANITLFAQWGKPCNVTYNANGGTCGTASEKYTGTALTLPTPTRDGYWFIGWYDAAEGGNIIGEAGSPYHPTAEITLYAHWQEQIEYTVTYDANGGTCGTSSATYEGTALILPTPTRTGYEFTGWSDGTSTYAAGATYVPSNNTTLIAQWEKLPTYTITIGTQSNATVTVNKDSTYAGDTVSVTVSFSQTQNRSLKVTDANNNELLSKSAAGTYTFTMPNSNVTITASSEKPSCVTGDTLVTLADGTQKRIDQVTFDDKILVWDFDKGEYTFAGASIIENHGYGNNDVIELEFEDGTTIKVVNVHGFFDANLNKWVDIDANNVFDFIGHSFTQVNGASYKTVKLVSATVTTEYIEAWSILTADHYNCILEGLFSVTPPATLQLAFFEIGEGMMYDVEAKANDIETYGLYTYEEFAHLLTEAEFEALNIAEIKVAVGKGLITYDEILWLIATYIH